MANFKQITFVFCIFIAPLFQSTHLQAQDPAAYRIFDNQGKQLTYSDMMQRVRSADVVFFGELHDNPIAHWMEMKITQALYETKKEKLVLGAEMFEADNQLIVDEYLKGQITDAVFEKECRVWKNYPTDYKPLMSFAKQKKLRFIATNIPNRYAKFVFREGLKNLDKLDKAAKQTMAPIPIEFDINVPCYKSMMQQMDAGHTASEFLPQAQAAKDATMAHFIAENWEKGRTFLHFNGSYHSDNKEGIIWYLNKMLKKADITNITVVYQENLDAVEKENLGKADFIIVVPASMTRTY